MMDAQEYEPICRILLHCGYIEDPEEHVSLPLDAPESPPEPDEQGRQWAGEAEGSSCSSNDAPTRFSGKNLRPNNTEDILYH